MKLLPFQREDLARASLHDGLILDWDTGLGKGIAALFWPLLKVGARRVPAAEAPPAEPCNRLHGDRLAPQQPVLIVAPGDLHAQIIAEAAEKFHAEIIPLTCQADFTRLVRETTADGRPIIPAQFYLTSYTQLCTNGLERLPDADDMDPLALLHRLSLPLGSETDAAVEVKRHYRSGELEGDPPPTVLSYFASRGRLWRDAYSCFSLNPDTATLANVQGAYAAACAELNRLADMGSDPRYLAKQRARYDEYLARLENLCPAAQRNANCQLPIANCQSDESAPGHTVWSDLTATQHDWIIREFCRDWLAVYARGQNESHSYDVPGAEPLPDGTPPQRRIKCVLAPSLSDLCFNAFACVVVDEGVRMKSDDTLIGTGLRQMAPPYRLVLTATPVKNRLPDIFWLAWWACGGHEEATTRWPYRDDPSEREAFAATFMVSEQNLTQNARLAAQGKSSRVKRTPEVCQIHRLWKLLAPVHLRRRKDDTGLSIPPKVRRVLRVLPGTQQRRVYQYHLDAQYLDINGQPAVVAQLQALRSAAADPSSPLLEPVAGGAFEECPKCRRKGVLPGNGANTPTHCSTCNGSGQIALPCRSGNAYVPKTQAALTLIGEILERNEQVVVFSAFNHPLDTLAQRLREASVRHVLLDGRTSQKKRGVAAAAFKRGRGATAPPRSAGLQPGRSAGLRPGSGNAGLRPGTGNAAGVDTLSEAEFDPGIPVMLAGVECMAEGHSFHLANNVILIAYSWAADKFIQAINRVHRITSQKPINVYAILVEGTIDARLEALTEEKLSAAELVLDGRLLGERVEEVNLAELLNIARRTFKEGSKLETMDEPALERQWPTLRRRLQVAATAWSTAPASNVLPCVPPAVPTVHPVRKVPVQTASLRPPVPVTIHNQGRPALPAWLQRARANAAALAVR